MDDCEEVVTDPWVVAQLRRQAREIHIESALLAVAVTGFALLLPG